MEDRDWTFWRHGCISMEAENELLEVSEDRRLQRLGIDPDLPQ
jgi:hypothetical protein